MTNKKFFSMDLQLMICILLLLHAAFAILLYFIGTRQKVLVYFSLLIFFTIITVLVDDDRLLLVWIPFEFDWALRLQFIFYTGSSALLIVFGKHMFPEYAKIKFLGWFVKFCILFSIFVLLAPAKYTVY
jgi:two-component system sensor histidine kinase ChiS